jgi:hypothetical protein
MLESLMPLQVTLPNEAVEKSSDDLALERCLHQTYFKDLRDLRSIPSMAQRNDPRLRSKRI